MNAEQATPAGGDAGERLSDHTFALCQAAREAGLAVTHARQIDVFRALKSIDWHNQDDYRLALRTNLVSSRQDEILFDRVFYTHFGDLEADYEGDYIMASSEMIRGTLEAGRSNEGHRDMLTDSDALGAEDVLRRANLAMRLGREAPPLEQVTRDAARRVATRPARPPPPPPPRRPPRPPPFSCAMFTRNARPARS